MLLMMNPQILCKMSKLISSFLKSFVILVSLRQGIPCCMAKVSEHACRCCRIQVIFREMQCGRFRKSQWWDSAGTTNTQIHKYTLDGALDYQPEIFPDFLYHRRIINSRGLIAAGVLPGITSTCII